MTTIAFQRFSLGEALKRAIPGYIFGFAVISFFVFSVNTPDPAWGQYWYIRPLIITTLAGACCGLLIYSANLVDTDERWIAMLARIATIIGAFIGLWLGIILGLDGTLWN
jgi:ABC-type dipeptide/oligopeptide/nickel transport system permease subunit